MPDRRQLLAAACALPLAGAARAAPAVADRPDPAALRTGDLVWPKPRGGVLVPYSGTAAASALSDAQELQEDAWNRERLDFILAARTAPAGIDADTVYVRELARAVENLTYTDFFHAYAAQASPGEFQTHGAGQLAYVGHVGVVQVDAGVPYVIEAVMGKTLDCTSCVQRVRYDRWLAARGDILVWHGRLRGLDAAQRGAVADVARSQVQKPYRFFNFNLADDRGFYCSKLVWYSVNRVTGQAVDGNTSPRRLIWFSPLQLMRTSAVELLSSPGDYRNT